MAWRVNCSVSRVADDRQDPLRRLFADALRRGMSRARVTIPDCGDADLATIADEYFKLTDDAPATGRCHKSAVFARAKHLESDPAAWAGALHNALVTMLSKPGSAPRYLARRFGGENRFFHPDVAAHLPAAQAIADLGDGTEAMVEEKDLRETAAGLAAEIFPQLDDVHRAVLWGLAHELKPNDPAVTALAKKSQSSLYRIQAGLRGLIESHIDRTHRLDGVGRAHLTLWTGQELIAWAKKTGPKWENPSPNSF